MLSPEYYDSCADVLLAHYAKLEDDIICDIIRRLMKTGSMTDTAKHQAEMLQQAGLLYEDIIRTIAARTDATAKQVQTVFEDAGVETVEIDNTVYRDMGKVPVDIRQSDSMRQVLEAGFLKTLGEVQNLTLTTAVTSQTAYKAACNSAYMQVSSGAFDYQTAIRNAIRQAAAQGVRVLYPSGHVSQLDVAIRRSVLTGIGQTCREIGLANADENGCDLMEITAHGGARPEHAKWQGQLVSRNGKLAGKIINGMRVYSLREIGYGDVQGFGGANCRHDWYPYFPGYSTPNYTERELEKLNERNIEWNGEKYTQYEVSQMQRAGERKVRALKREAAAYDTAAKNAPDSATELEMKNAFQVTSVKLKDAERQLSDFCKETGQDRDRFREQVHSFKLKDAEKQLKTFFEAVGQDGDRFREMTIGFGRSQAQRAVWAAKKPQNVLTSDADGGIIKSKEADGMKLIIDKFTPCLEDTKTGMLVPTVYKKVNKSDLSQLKGWNFNWLSKNLSEADVYKLCITGDDTIQGLVAVTDCKRDMAVYVDIAESAPHNLGEKKRFNGVGGHLFAIAARISIEKNYGGFVFMDAKNTELVKHYSQTLGAVLLGRPHPYRMFIDEESAAKLLSMYTFEEG